MTFKLRTGLALLVLVAQIGCGNKDDGTSPDTTPGTVGSDGGTVELASSAVKMNVPAGALGSSVTFTAAVQTSYPASTLVAQGSVYEIGPTGTVFSSPVTLTLGYDPGSLPDGVAEADLRLYTVVSGAWQLISGSTVNTSAHTVSGSISHLSTYGVLGLEVSSVTVSPASSSLSVGGTAQLTATVKGEDGSTLNGRPVVWSSSAESVATVDATGLVTAVGEGDATITATSGGESGTAGVTVTVPVASVEVDPASADLQWGESVQLTAGPMDADGNALDRSVTWSSSDDGVATVDDNGLVTATGAGTATITATSEGVQGTATITVTDPVNTVAVDPTSATVMVGATVQLTATVTALSGTVLSSTVTWTSSNEAVATVDSDGLVTAAGSGTATITATVDGVQGTAQISVPLDLSGLVGTWTGSWHNETYNTTGGATIVISVDQQAKTMSFNVDFDGNVFGGSNPPAETFTGSYTETSLTITGHSNTFGDISATWNGDGFSGSGQNVPAGGIDSVDFTGTVTATQISMNYTIHFSGGGTAVGTVTLNKS